MSDSYIIIKEAHYQNYGGPGTVSYLSYYKMPKPNKEGKIMIDPEKLEPYKGFSSISHVLKKAFIEAFDWSVKETEETKKAAQTLVKAGSND